ncbi:MAG: 4Fe-4S dicluster domain-containing protein [Firmicutes bacterium]|nr:4Fe-4S dicluster domain-containing protein [Bacillota bacterium]
MGIRVNFDKCSGCGLCEEYCPMDCIRIDESGKPYFKYDHCWYCGACETECPSDACKITIPYLIR